MDLNTSPRALALKAEYPELNHLGLAWISERLNLEAIFPEDTGWGSKKRNQNRVKYLLESRALLEAMLLGGEVIEFVGRGVYYSVGEYFFGGGVWSRYHNLTTILLTNYRLIFLNTDSKGKPNPRLYRQAHPGRLKKIKPGFFGSLQLKFDDGKSEMWNELTRKESKRLAERLQARSGQPPRPLFAEVPASPAGLENLCTTCLKPVPAKTWTCPHCQTTFRAARSAILRSLLLPGLGELYLKQVTLSVIKMIFTVLIYFALLINLASGQAKPEDLVGLVIVILLINGSSAIATYAISLKGLVPLKDGAITSGRQR